TPCITPPACACAICRSTSRICWRRRWHERYFRHSRESGNPVFISCKAKSLDSGSPLRVVRNDDTILVMNSGKELRLLLATLRDLHRNVDQRAALATITRTRGSTFRHAGTHMLVRSNGEVVCELSGGCPQRDIVQRALEVIATRQPRLVNYNAESGLDLLMEMGCGGELEVLIEPLGGADVGAIAEALQRCLDERRKAWLATWFADERAVVTPRRLVIDGDRISHDAIGDPLLRQSILEAVGEQPERSQTLRLPSSSGIADVLLEPVAPPHALTIIGCSATALALLPVAETLGWQVTLVDGDPQHLRAAGLPREIRTICAG